jgi:3-oxoacyl-[acyl-carrier-protein] synthase-3
VSERRTVVVSTGSYIPSRTVSNADFVPREFFAVEGGRMDPADNDRVVAKFQEITEIAERRHVTEELVTSDVAFLAAEQALESGRIDRESLDYLIVAHNFGDVRSDNRRSDMVPTLAARVKRKLGIRNPGCIAYDLPFGCPGWLQGVIQAHYFLRSGDASRALVIGAETLSRVSDPHDRDSMLYSDGAGAAVLEARESDEPIGVLAHAARSDALEHASLMWMGASYNPDHEGGPLYLKMQGRKLYEYAVTTVPGLVLESLRKAGVALADVGKVLMHQANAKMNGMILKRLFKLGGIDEAPSGVMPMTIARLGNSSVATIPTLLDLILRGELPGQRIASGDVLVFAAVGAGMNINSVVYRWP